MGIFFHYIKRRKKRKQGPSGLLPGPRNAPTLGIGPLPASSEAADLGKLALWLLPRMQTMAFWIFQLLKVWLLFYYHRR